MSFTGINMSFKGRYQYILQTHHHHNTDTKTLEMNSTSDTNTTSQITNVGGSSTTDMYEIQMVGPIRNFPKIYLTQEDVPSSSSCPQPQPQLPPPPPTSAAEVQHSHSSAAEPSATTAATHIPEPYCIKIVCKNSPKRRVFNFQCTKQSMRVLSMFQHVPLKENVSNSESRANSAEGRCKLLTDNNSKLNEELALLKDGGNTSGRVDLLERQLKESDLKLQNALASSEASHVKQTLLYSTIRDMENVIKDLKSKVSKAKSRADSAEENCIILSESNAELNEELSFLGSRLECLEGSLHRDEEAKMATAKDLEKQTKVLKNLVTQLAVEREHLKLQLSSLASENNILVMKLKLKFMDPIPS